MASDTKSGYEKWLWEDGTGIALEDGSGVWLLESGAQLNNYKFVKVGDGMSASETIK